MTKDLETCFAERCRQPSNINEHMPILRLLASECRHITEFGVNTGNSPCAFLTGLRTGGHLVSYDLNVPVLDFPTDPARWTFRQENVDQLELFDGTDLLFIDAFHNYTSVQAELRYAPQVRRLIVLHDTVLFGAMGDDGTEGILRAIGEFLHAHPEWTVSALLPNNNGLAALLRL